MAPGAHERGFRISASALLVLGGLCVCAAHGCTGEIHGSGPIADSDSGGEPSANPGSSSGSGATGDDPKTAPDDPSRCRPPPSRVVRLSKLEIQNSVADLLA